MFVLVKLILLLFMSSHFIQSIVTNLLHDTGIPTSPMLVLFLVNLMKIEIVITSSLGVVMYVIVMNPSSLMLSIILLMSHFVLVMLVNMNVVVININSVHSRSSNTVVIRPKMIFPPIIDWIKESLLM